MDTTLLVLEQPWWPPKDDPKRSSVLPFLEGIARFNNIELRYSTFYDAQGFKLALETDLTHTIEGRQILYIGMHGDWNKKSAREAAEIMECIRDFGEKIEGVILSSCYFGNRIDNLKIALSKSANGSYGARWIFGYRYAVNWMETALIDMSVLNEIINKKSLKKRDDIIDNFYYALNIYNKNAIIASDRNNNEKTLSDSIQLVIRGQGAKEPREATFDLNLKLRGYR